MKARNLTTNVPKILDLRSSSENVTNVPKILDLRSSSENCRWVPLFVYQLICFDFVYP